MFRAIALQHTQQLRLNLVDGIGAINCSIWLVRVVQADTCLNELVHGLATERFPSGGSIFLLVVFSWRSHDGRKANKRGPGFTPNLAWCQIQKAQETQCR